MSKSTGKRAANLARNAAILALYGKKSFDLIAEELGTTRNVVAGAVFRARHPAAVRYRASGACNKIGTGHHGCGPYAARTLLDARDPA